MLGKAYTYFEMNTEKKLMLDACQSFLVLAYEMQEDSAEKSVFNIVVDRILNAELPLSMNLRVFFKEHLAAITTALTFGTKDGIDRCAMMLYTMMRGGKLDPRDIHRGYRVAVEDEKDPYVERSIEDLLALVKLKLAKLSTVPIKEVQPVVTVHLAVQVCSKCTFEYPLSETCCPICEKGYFK